MRKLFVLISLLVGTVFAFAGGSQSSNQAAGGQSSVTLTDWTPYGAAQSRAIADYAAQKVKERFPNVILEFENYPQDGGVTIRTRAATGDLPDILSINSGLIESLSKSNNVIQLDEYFRRFQYGDKLVPGALETGVYSPDGHIYQFNTNGVNPHLWFYNKKIFADNGVKVPENYEELLAAVTTFRQKGITPLAMFGKEPWPLGAFFDSFAMKANPEGFYALSEGKALASDPAYTSAINKMKTLIDAGIFQRGVTNADFDTASAMFTEGQSAMFINGCWYISDILAKMESGAVDFMPYYPTADRGRESANRQYMAGGGDTDGYAVSSGSKNKDIAAEAASIYAYYRTVAEYTMNRRVEVPIKKEGFTVEQPLEPISEKLMNLLPEYSFKSRYIHTLSNVRFATTFTEELQKFVVGESVNDFIANIDRSIRTTTDRN
jgi:raffinose/stachyose/melibiose transport system substrate-binding protein